MSEEKFSQADQRSYRVFTDQHGRKWGADIEKKTQHPCGPMAPMFQAPMFPAQKFLKVTDAAAGLITIDYDAWILELQQAHLDYLAWAREEAFKMFGEMGTKALEDRHPGLMARVGEAPEPVERVKAAKAGNRWVLGIPMPDGSPAPRPAKADLYFPPAKKKEEVDPLADEGSSEPEVEEYAIDFPHMYAPGRWWLTRDHMIACKAGVEKGFQGNKEDAIEAASLRESEPVTA